MVWKAGESGNPKGRPVGSVNRLLQQFRTAAEAVLPLMLARALGGDFEAQKFILERGIPIGLGSDVAGGANSSIFRAISDAIQVSKLRQTLVSPTEKALTLEEAFYLGSAGGGSFFGKLKNTEVGPAGSFEPGWDFDALIIDDGAFTFLVKRNLRDRLERVVCLSDSRNIIEKYVRGVSVL